jgi:hypothetical protein
MALGTVNCVHHGGQKDKREWVGRYVPVRDESGKLKLKYAGIIIVSVIVRNRVYRADAKAGAIEASRREVGGDGENSFTGIISVPLYAYCATSGHQNSIQPGLCSLEFTFFT